jgi:hypothetical protein
LTFDGSLTQSGRYTFDEASGSCRTNQSIAHFDLLLAGWLKLDQTLRVGNWRPRGRRCRTSASRSPTLPAGAFNTSFLAPTTGSPAQSKRVLGKIDDALNEMKV